MSWNKTGPVVAEIWLRQRKETDGRTDRQTDKLTPIYPQTYFLRGIKRR